MYSQPLETENARLLHDGQCTYGQNVFRLMLFENEAPSSFTSMINGALACSNLRRHDGLRLGKQLHAYGLRTGIWRAYTNNAFMVKYAKN
jgi:hypothetical protein